MNKDDIVTIDGRQYNAKTGTPVTGRPVKKSTPAGSVHSSLQRSQTLIRRVTKRPSAISTHPKHTGRTMDIARSGKISRFAPHPVVASTPVTIKDRDVKDVRASVHPLVRKANRNIEAARLAATPQPAKTSQDIKQEAIVEALAKPPVKTPRKSFFGRHSRAFTIAAIVTAIVVVGGYFTYVNMPSWSVRVAAASAGINATYPQYRPDGYSLSGGPQWSDGQVTLNFTANTGTSKFSIKQAKSSWDSSAVLDNIVRKETGESYITNQERGLTIYTYRGNAAWVNGGILYTIQGDAPLSGEQIRHIAVSL